MRFLHGTWEFISNLKQIIKLMLRPTACEYTFLNFIKALIGYLYSLLGFQDGKKRKHMWLLKLSLNCYWNKYKLRAKYFEHLKSHQSFILEYTLFIWNTKKMLIFEYAVDL